MEINVISGALYTQDGKKIADVKDSSIMLVDELYKQRTMEVAENIGKTHSITCQLCCLGTADPDIKEKAASLTKDDHTRYRNYNPERWKKSRRWQHGCRRKCKRKYAEG